MTVLLDRLREDILACRLAPGERLKFEVLRTSYEASMGSLREALSRLASEGLVVSEANRGFTVAAFSVSELLDITELRVDLECKALGSAIEHGDEDWEARVVAAFHLLQKLQPTTAQWTQRHHDFHEALVSPCTSPWVLRFRAQLFDQARRYRSLSMKHSSSPGRMAQHRQLMVAVLARDTDRACALAEAHIRDTARNTLRSLPGYRPADLKLLSGDMQ